MGKRKKLMRELDRTERFDLDDDFFFGEDSLSRLRENYGDRLDTLPGCLELLESFVLLNNGEIPSNGDYITVYNRFQELIYDAEKNGGDVREFKKSYDSLSKICYEYDIKIGNGVFDSRKSSKMLDEINAQREDLIKKIESRKTGKPHVSSCIRIVPDTLDPKFAGFRSGGEVYDK